MARERDAAFIIERGASITRTASEDRANPLLCRSFFLTFFWRGALAKEQGHSIFQVCAGVRVAGGQDTHGRLKAQDICYQDL